MAKFLLTLIFCILSLTACAAPKKPPTTPPHPKVSKSLVEISIKGKNSGTGFFLAKGKDLVIITNFHVCVKNYVNHVKKNEPYEVPEELLGKSINVLVSLKVMKYDSSVDLCMLKVTSKFNKEHIYFLELAEPPLKRRAHLVTLSRPFLKPVVVPTNIISKDKTKDLFTRFHQDSWFISTYIVPGMSGSPLVINGNKVVKVVWGTDHTNKGGVVVGYNALRNFVKD